MSSEPIIVVGADGNVTVGKGVTFDQALQALEHARRVLGSIVLRPADAEPTATPDA